MQRPRTAKKSSEITTALRPFQTFSDRAVTSVCCVLLAAIVWIVFGQTIGYEFVNYDDDNYIYENPRITNGVTLSGIQWAFTHVHASNWHPLTTISHMVDCQLYGLQPWGHHLTNILLQAAAAILLFLALRKLTGDIWPSGFVAAVFAIHPLRVESVAWISERKDLLSGIFFMLTLWAYARYARSERPSPGRYLVTIVFFALGLMCKSSLVTLPFVLLLLDHWPLNRFLRPDGTIIGRLSAVRDLIVEKIPLFLLSAAACLITLTIQKKVWQGNLSLTLAERLCNAVVSYVAYLGEMIYPARLAVFYPYQTDSLKTSQVILAFLLLLIISVFLWIWRRKYPFLLIGWFWFLGMLVPMIGLIQVGSQARADRYTYLPMIGLYILVTWGAIELFGKWRHRREVLAVAASLILTALVARSYGQASFWQNSTTLWSHAIDIAPPNYLAHDNLGNAFLLKGQLKEAVDQYDKALEINTDYPEAHSNLGVALFQMGENEKAFYNFQEALRLDPNYAIAIYNRGLAAQTLGRTDEADRYFARAKQAK